MITITKKTKVSRWRKQKTLSAHQSQDVRDKIGCTDAFQTVSEGNMNSLTDKPGRSLREDISLREYICYGFGDFGCSIVYYLILSISVYYYTDVVGLSAAVVGSIIGISTLFDGITDVLIGFVVDRTHSRFGKARAWVLWMIIPFGVTLVACFTVPLHATDTIKALYIFVTYNLAVTVVYTAINLPYGTLSTLMTRDAQQRGVINVFRMTFSAIGGLFGVSACLPMVKYFGNDYAAWIKTMSIMAVIGMILMLLTFLGCKERVREDAESKGQRVPFGTALKSMLMNKYWILVTIMCFVFAAYNSLNGTYRTYYCKYILGDEMIYSALNTAEFIGQGITAVICAWLIRKWGKSTIVTVGSVLACIAQGLIIASPYSASMITAAAFIRGLGTGTFYALMFTMVADVIEYGHWRTGVRAEGLLFSANTVGQKVGSAITTAVCGAILTASGYDGLQVVQTASAEATISTIYIWAPVLWWGLMAVFCLINRKLDKEYDQIIEDLQANRLHPKAKLQKEIKTL